MDTTIIENINAVVGENDILWHLGDFAYGRSAQPNQIQLIRNKIRCKNIMLIVGNHDKKVLKNTELKRMFTAILPCFVGHIEGKPVVLTHVPPKKEIDPYICGMINGWKNKFSNSPIFYGHVHNNSDITKYNMCVENIGYKPLLLQDLL